MSRNWGPSTLLRVACLLGAAAGTGACGLTKVNADGGGGGIVGGGSGAATLGGSGGAAGGSGGTSDAGTGGGGGVGCVDIVIHPDRLGEPRDWGLVSPFSGGVWRTSSGLHVGWKADIRGINRPRLFLATFDPATGSLLKLGRYDVLPSTATSNDSDIQAVSGSDSELFAASLRSWDVLSQPGQSLPRNQTLFIGRLDDDSFRMEIDLGWPSGAYDVTDVGWDGLAFVVHSRRNSTGEVFLARVSPQGQVILPSTKYGSTLNPGGTPLGYRMSTNATSGSSFLFDVDSGKHLTAHERSGPALPWSRLNVVIPEVSAEGAGILGTRGVAADPEGGAWTTWNQYGTSAEVVRITAHVTGTGEINAWFVLRSPTPSSLLTRTGAAVVASSEAKVWVAERVHQQVYLYEIDGATLAGPRKVFENPYYDGSQSTWLGVSELGGLSWQDERWLWFTESGFTVGPPIHMIKISGDCTYLPAAKPNQVSDGGMQ